MFVSRGQVEHVRPHLGIRFAAGADDRPDHSIQHAKLLGHGVERRQRFAVELHHDEVADPHVLRGIHRRDARRARQFVDLIVAAGEMRPEPEFVAYGGHA